MAIPPRIGLDIGSDSLKAALIEENGRIEALGPERVLGRPLLRAREALAHFRERGIEVALLGCTGSGADGLAALASVESVDEMVALAQAFLLLDPTVTSVIEMGRESQRYLRIRRDESAGRMLIEHSARGHKCAAGTGSFLEHMRRRLRYESMEDFARVALETDRPATLAGRCGVFAESDIVHLFQRGVPKERIVAGIHRAICRSYRNAVLKRQSVEGRVAFVGGVSRNPAVRQFLREELSLDGALTVPEHNVLAGAIGAALEASREVRLAELIEALDDALAAPLAYHASGPLRLEQSVRMTAPPEDALPSEVARAGLGIDIGSVSTKAALVTEVDGRPVLLASHYRRTEGSPIDAVRDTLEHIRRQVEERGLRIGEIVAGTTGSGRYLTGDLVGADVIRNEITSQANGAICFDPDVDTILEIGGQDSKYIRLEGGVVVDFEMNRACAAGTGAFLETQAEHLGLAIQEMGAAALAGTRPPELDWQCTVFSETAMIHYQQNNVSGSDLAAAVCLAAARNYLNKNVASRSIGERVAFQGAVAFNDGMVAALETLLERPVHVPPHPHLTGAVGAAVLALREGPAEGTSFLGFDRIAQAEYESSSFECAACANRCEVSTFRLGDGPTFHAGDRCERFSAQRVSRTAAPVNDTPDLFAEYESLLFAEWQPETEGPRVAVPRGLLFADYFPLWNGFLRALGCAVVPGPPTSRQAVLAGVELSRAEPCFPMKVAHGQLVQALESEAEFVFLPTLHDTDQPNPNWERSETCPYVQGAEDVLLRAIPAELRDSRRLLSAHLRLSRGREHALRELTPVAEALGVRDRRTIAAAVDAGFAALGRFRAAVRKRGEEILGGLGEEETAFVVLGRPYALHEPALNMRIAKRIRELGILAIPQDFLPLDDEDPSDHWANAFARQIQRRLAAARCIRSDPRLHAVVLTYFGCGPDSFGNIFFREELDGPCYVMQIDEHTADAGAITRIEAFADTIRAKPIRRRESPSLSSDAPPLGREHLGKTVWVPNMPGGAEVLAGTLRAWGFDGQVLPESPDPALNRARKAISEDVCLPALITTEDILARLEAPDFDPTRELFFQGSAQGPCRYGMYSMLQRLVLDHADRPQAAVVSLGLGSAEGGPGVGMVLATYMGFVTSDMLARMLHRTRPYERERGAAEAVYERYLAELTDLPSHHRAELDSRGGRLLALLGRKLGPWEDLVSRAGADFARIPADRVERPLIGVVGEFYVRMHPRANRETVRKLEAAGAEVWLAPLGELFAYANAQRCWLLEDAQRDRTDWRAWGEIAFRRLLARTADSTEHRLHESAGALLEGMGDPPVRTVMAKGAEWVHRHFGGEAILSMGKASDFADRGLDGVVSIAPFHCMPGMTVTALGRSFQEERDRMPFLELEFDGFEDQARDAAIRMFVRQARDRRELRRSAGEG